jgi:hypothetical protein
LWVQIEIFILSRMASPDAQRRREPVVTPLRGANDAERWSPKALTCVQRQALLSEAAGLIDKTPVSIRQLRSTQLWRRWITEAERTQL